ncbi:hypothetical protein [Sphaerisporangium sp. NPDC051011]|uniref:hypothetical protein n=1 Tax=Sphaerisporangium sp. NPDC051011 TaxID=3155792 RepID=UPI003403C48C
MLNGHSGGVLDPSLPDAERLRLTAWAQALGIELRYDGQRTTWKTIRLNPAMRADIIQLTTNYY